MVCIVYTSLSSERQRSQECVFFFFFGGWAADDNNEEWDGVVRKTEGRQECKAELSFLASLVRDAGAAERHRWEELSRCVTETHKPGLTHKDTHA